MSRGKEIPAVMTNRVLLTGARSICALELARHLHLAGHTVIACDTETNHLARYSNAIEKFLRIPSPRFQTESFIDSIVKITQEEKIDWIIPIWEEVVYLSLFLNRIPEQTKIFCSPFQIVHALHHKWLFIEKLKSMGFLFPETILIRSNEDIMQFEYEKSYVLKACYSRGSRKILQQAAGSSPPMNLGVSQSNPWIAQEYISGNRFCSYSVCHQGNVKAHAVYPVIHTMDKNSCLSFEAVNHEQILFWVKSFVEKINFTGHIAFDFIETKEGALYAIECNPRATSGVHLFKTDENLAAAFFNENTECIVPEVGNTQQILIGMAIFGWKDAFSERKLFNFLKKLLTTKDVVFRRGDLFPFFWNRGYC